MDHSLPSSPQHMFLGCLELATHGSSYWYANEAGFIRPIVRATAGLAQICQESDWNGGWGEKTFTTPISHQRYPTPSCPHSNINSSVANANISIDIKLLHHSIPVSFKLVQNVITKFISFLIKDFFFFCETSLSWLNLNEE